LVPRDHGHESTAESKVAGNHDLSLPSLPWHAREVDDQANDGTMGSWHNGPPETLIPWRKQRPTRYGTKFTRDHEANADAGTRQQWFLVKIEAKVPSTAWHQVGQFHQMPIQTSGQHGR
jgi:hypothetical protein